MTSLTRISLVARPEISTRKKKKTTTLQAFLTPHFSKKLPSRSADPGSANAASECERSLAGFLEDDVVNVGDENVLFLCSWYMWLYVLCYWQQNVKIGQETDVWNFKVEMTTKVFLSEFLKPAAGVLASESWEVLQQEGTLRNPETSSQRRHIDPWSALRLSANGFYQLKWSTWCK